MPLLNLVIDICRLRRAPQDLPYSPALLVGAAAADVVVQCLVTAVARGSSGGGVLSAVLSVAVTMTVLHLALTLRGIANRFVQSGAALLFCSAIFTVVLLPLVVLTGSLASGDTSPEVLAQASPLQVMAAFGTVILSFWKLIVNAHILRHTFDLPFIGGLGIALGWVLVLLTVAVGTGGMGH